MLGIRLADRYEISGELGRGGMGMVYRARDPLLNREVAVKLLPATLLTPEAEERFQREAQVVAQMDHPAIVPIYDIGRHEGALFFVMPVVRGTSLRVYLKERSLRLGDVLDVGIEVAEALEYAHQRGVVHRDIKPENVMLFREERGDVRVRIMDFGLAVRTTEDRLTKSGSLVGTIAYLSPEQVGSAAVDGRADLYSLGTVLYECLVGEAPFTGDIQQVLYRIVHENARSPRAVNGAIDEELAQLVLRCLAKDPTRRPARAAEMADALRRYRTRLNESERLQAVGASSVWTLDLKRPSASQLVGREREFSELQQRLEMAIAGECQLVLVAGPPGIGKSRLLLELETLARMRKIRVLHGRFVELDRAFPYQGFCELIQGYFRTRAASLPGETLELSDLASDLISLFPVLGEIRELRAAATGDSKVTPAQEAWRAEDRLAIFELLARTLSRLSGGKPLVLNLENLHRGEVSIEALQYVVRRLGATPTLVVGSYRSTEVDRRHPLNKLLVAFSDDPRFASILLAPLSPEEHRKLVEMLLPGGKLGPGAAEKLFEATEGNPFFARELVQSLLDSGGISRGESGAWQLAGGLAFSEGGLPATLQQAVEQRVARFPEEMQEVLYAASVLGRSFDLRALKALVEKDAERSVKAMFDPATGVRVSFDVDEAVDRLVQQGLLEEERGSRGDRLVFPSAIVRDVLYAALPRRRRKSLHRRHAEELERRHAGRLHRVYPELLYHYSQGDVPEKSVRYGLAAARAAIDAFSPDDAARAARTVLDFVADESWEGERLAEGEARLLLARALRMDGSLDAALREAEKAVKVFEDEKAAGEAAKAIQLLAEAAWEGRRIEETKRWAERGIERARQAGEAASLARCLSLAATVANLRGDADRAKVYLEELERLTARPSDKERSGEEIPVGGTLVVAMANPIRAKEPATVDLVEEDEVLSNIFETLASTDSMGNLVPWLAERWEVLDGGRRILLSIRPGVRFSDGSPLTARDVVASFERLLKVKPDDPPAALADVEGVAELRSGAADRVSGFAVTSDHELEIRLTEPLPLYPSLLTDTRTALVHVAADGSLAGTGPFRLAEHRPERVLLKRNPDTWSRAVPRLDAVEFRPSLGAPAIAVGLRSGELDLVRDLLPQDLDELLRDPHLRSRIVEAAKKNSYFVLFNTSGPVTRDPLVRRALAGVVRPDELVWRTAGRFAQAATGLLPPGVLGHDPGRRRPSLPREKALELLRTAGRDAPFRLRASVHPVFAGRYAAILNGLLDAWRELGAEVDNVTTDMESFLETGTKSAGIDFRVGRWIADYADPDAFTHGLFHSKNGRFRSYFSSPETDGLLEAARAEPGLAARETLYRRFESLLLEQAVVVPLFHDIDYRIAHPRVRGCQLRGTPPYVNYAEIGKVERLTSPAAARREGGGVLHIPIPAELTSLDPTGIATVEEAEVLPNVFESLTRVVEGARVVPWLASEIVSEEAGRRYRFRLRETVRFHDGRRLTARDVRYSFERLLSKTGRAARARLAPIHGAGRLTRGETSVLEGFRIVSATEFTVDLETPVSFFPALLADPATAIFPEGHEGFRGGWRDGCVGTGPFRIAKFEPGVRLELERNPIYWRDGLPKADGLVFHFGLSPEAILSGFREGRLSLGSDLFPEDVESLRHEPVYAPGYREIPLLSTYFVAFNIHEPPLDDVELRRHLVQAVDTDAIVKRALGRIAIPAHGLIPPGLLGYERGRDTAAPRPPRGEEPPEAPFTFELNAVVNPIFLGQFGAMTRELYTAFKQRGVRIHPVNRTWAEFREARTAPAAHLYVGRGVADYPDADTFAQGVLHTRDGNIGRYCGSPPLDALVDRARAETDPPARHALYREIEETVARDALLIPLFHEQVYRFARPEVEGLNIAFSTPPIVAYENLWIRR